ncbi:MAG: hypothetical protein GY865_10080, partial [candidate division Zixibacteria bacterium]|nr:hypothetical protein [candidate division Zixibacteria bacterium]
VLSKHLYSNNILPEQINFKVNYDSAILNILRQADTEKSEEYLDQYFDGRVIVRNRLSERDSELNRFHYLLEDNFYNSVKVKSVSKLLEQAESFLIRYNYNENYNSSLNLPPNQLICRQYGGDFGPELLKFKPILLKKNRASTARYLIGLKMMAGLFTSMAGSVISRKNRVKRIGKIGITNPIQKANTITELPKPLPPKTRIKTTEKQLQDSKSIENKFEYISLNKMNWEKPEGRQIENDSRTGIGRNRKELIHRAKELLAQKRSIAELKKTLPMTEGELSMLSQNITISDKERNIQ